MFRAVFLGALALACAFVFSLFFAVPGWSAGLHPECNVTMPCAVPAVAVSKRDRARIARADRYRNVEFGAPMYPPETARSFLAKGGDSKPRAWCGWWMRHYLGVKNPAGNLARWWAGYGAKASGPAVGTIVVWARGRRSGHVGIITGQAGNGQWVVKSGNDGNAVRERVRSVSGAIAFRWPA